MKSLLFLGVGSIAQAVQRAFPNVPALGTTRSTPDARFANINALASHDASAITAAAEGAHVLVSFPPDGHSDAAFAALVSGAASVVYLSSTAVYPPDAGRVTEETPVTNHGERALSRLAAETIWLGVGASVVRLPAFYGPSSGLHLSIARGTFRMPGPGTNIVSRVHVADAARFVDAAFSAPRGSLLLAGDEEPASVLEVVSFVCELFGLPLPAASEGEEIPLSLRGNRSVDNVLTRTRFDVRLAYPTYREGYGSLKPS